MKLLKPFLVSFFISFMLIISLLIYIMFIRQPHYFQYAEPWLINLYKGKDYINEMETTKRRLLILSGSNSLFGFNGEIIDNLTPFKPINYASHAALPLNYHIDRIMQHAKEGDIIFLPLEFDYYIRNAPNIDSKDIWYIHNMLSWGNGYEKYISRTDKLYGYLKNSPSRSIEWFFKGFKAKYKDIFDKEKMFKEMPFNFGYTSLSKYGDFCTQQGVLADIKASYLNVDSKVSSFFVAEFKRLESFGRARNIKVFLTYPVTLENTQFSLKDSKTFEKIQNLITQLESYDIKIYGDFTDFHFDREYFYNTEYHLNDKGTILRSKAFVKFLENMQETGEI